MVIMCLLCVVVGRFSLVSFVGDSPSHEFDPRNFIYLAHLCTCAPNVCNEILGQYDIFFKWQRFFFLPTIASPACMVGHRAFIFHTDVY